MGWLIDLAEQCAFVYSPDQPTTVYDKITAKLPVPPFAQDFHLTIADLLGWFLE